MSETEPSNRGPLIHVVTLECKDAENARRCLEALAGSGRPDALAYKCVAYEFGIREGKTNTVCLVERWNRWEDLDALLREKVVPALPTYNSLLKRPFDPERDTARIRLSGG